MMATARQKAASRRNLIKARAARKRLGISNKPQRVARRRAAIEKRFGKKIYPKLVAKRAAEGHSFGVRRGAFGALANNPHSTLTMQREARGREYARTQKIRKQLSLETARKRRIHAVTGTTTVRGGAR